MMFPRSLPPLALGLAATLLAGCATAPERQQLPEPLVLPERTSETGPITLGPEAEAPATEMRRTATPTRPDVGRTSAGTDTQARLPAGLDGPAVAVNVENMPVPAFADEVFGNLLGINYRLDASVSALRDLVTLRTPDPQSPADLYRLATQVLGEYGVLVQPEGDIVTLKVAASSTSAAPPLVLSGRAMPDVPTSHRPVFYLMELQAIRSNEALRWLRTLYKQEIQAEEDSLRNALLLSGRPDQVRQAVEALQVFDRPYMRGRASTRLEPVFMGAEELASRMVEVLTAEGFGAARALGTPASILVLPIASVNAVIVFTKDRTMLEHAVDWARQLDRPNPASTGNSMFYYPVQNTQASEIAATLSGANRGGGRNASRPATAQVPTTLPGGEQVAPALLQQQQRASSSAGGESGGFTLLVDEPRNALIFQGEPAEWERMLPLIRQMDRAARQVMIEVTIAEVSLDDNEEFGVSWFAKSPLDRFSGSVNVGTLPGTGTGTGDGDGDDGGVSGGLTYLLDLAGQNRALLRAFANDQRVSILSTPRLLVMSGKEASIDVGTEVPTLSAQTTSAQQTEGNSNLLQSIQYRKTGIILNIKPTVYSDDRIDLEISQEVSEALPLGDSSSIDSPSIFNRSVNTSLSLRDGGSVILGGLMSQRETMSDSGVPFLKDIPILGNLVKSQSKRRNKTELVLMIVPYIIGSDQRASDVTQAISNQLELLELPEAATSGATAPAVVPYQPGEE